MWIQYVHSFISSISTNTSSMICFDKHWNWRESRSDQFYTIRSLLFNTWACPWSVCQHSCWAAYHAVCLPFLKCINSSFLHHNNPAINFSHSHRSIKLLLVLKKKKKKKKIPWKYEAEWAGCAQHWTFILCAAIIHMNTDRKFPQVNIFHVNEKLKTKAHATVHNKRAGEMP